jgi:hypothetical protein
MNYYASEQLARQRHDQFAREASRGSLARLARSASPSSQPNVGPWPLRPVASLIWRLGGAMLSWISRPMRQRRGATDSPNASRAIGQRII